MVKSGMPMNMREFPCDPVAEKKNDGIGEEWMGQLCKNRTPCMQDWGSNRGRGIGG